MNATGISQVWGPFSHGRRWRLRVVLADGDDRWESFTSHAEAVSALAVYREALARSTDRVLTESLVALGATPLPEEPAWVYLLRDASGAVVYVGCTSDPVGRRIAHMRDKTFASMALFQPMQLQLALAFESALIARLQPALNTVGTNLGLTSSSCSQLAEEGSVNLPTD